MIYLLIAILLFTAVSILSAAASRKTDSNLVSLIINVFSMLGPAIVLAPAFIAKKSIPSIKYALVMAALAGISVGLFSMTINKSYTVNKVGVVLPVIFGGTMLLSTVLSYFIFKETLKGFELVGLGLVLVGISFIIYARV